jgi:hypothetical protein
MTDENKLSVKSNGKCRDSNAQLKKKENSQVRNRNAVPENQAKQTQRNPSGKIIEAQDKKRQIDNLYLIFFAAHIFCYFECK